MKRLTIILIVLAMTVLVIAGCGSTGSTTKTTTAPAQTTTKATTTEATTTEATTTAPATLTLGDPVDADPFTVTLKSAKVVKVDNQFADVKNAVRIEIEITNNSAESEDIMMLQKTFYGPDGTEVESLMIGAYFDDALDITSSIRAGKTLSGYVYAAYSEDGEYIAEISYLMGDVTEIYFDVKK